MQIIRNPEWIGLSPFSAKSAEGSPAAAAGERQETPGR
jgi:hypothetical protein